MEKDTLSRRELLTKASAVGLASALPLPALQAACTGSSRPFLRIAHMTDFHIQPEQHAVEGVEKAFLHAQEQKPDLILCGGDMIMDSFNSGRSRTRLQWQLWNKVVRQCVSVPIRYCLGNHDIWGWNKKGSETSGSEALWGKKWAQEMLELPQLYYSFYLLGWRIVVLDSVQPQGQSFVGMLDDAQFTWLEQDLKAVHPDQHVLLLSHMPIHSAAAIYTQDYDESYLIPGTTMHTDAKRLKDLFKQHKQVKVALSGHVHMVDRVDYLGVSYLCNGAVCGSWWNGPLQEFEPGYALIDLYPDGRFERRYVPWGWKRV